MSETHGPTGGRVPGEGHGRTRNALALSILAVAVAVVIAIGVVMGASHRGPAVNGVTPGIIVTPTTSASPTPDRATPAPTVAFPGVVVNP